MGSEMCIRDSSSTGTRPTPTNHNTRIHHPEIIRGRPSNDTMMHMRQVRRRVFGHMLAETGGSRAGTESVARVIAMLSLSLYWLERWSCMRVRVRVGHLGVMRRDVLCRVFVR